MLTKCNFWTGGPILKIRVLKRVPRRREIFLYFSQFSIRAHAAPIFAKTFWLEPVFFANTGSKWAPIEIWLKCKNVFRLLCTRLDTQIFKIGRPTQKLRCLIIYFIPLCADKSKNNQWQKMVTKCNFWTGGSILKIWLPKRMPRRRKTFLYFNQISIRPHDASVFAKTFWIESVFCYNYILLSFFPFFPRSLH